MVVTWSAADGFGTAVNVNQHCLILPLAVSGQPQQQYQLPGSQWQLLQQPQQHSKLLLLLTSHYHCHQQQAA
jgi:hypothetical protein